MELHGVHPDLCPWERDFTVEGYPGGVERAEEALEVGEPELAVLVAASPDAAIPWNHERSVRVTVKDARAPDEPGGSRDRSAARSDPTRLEISSLFLE